MRLLLVESDLAVARKLQSRWQREHLWIVRHVRDFQGADEALGDDQFDVVMLGGGLATPAGLAWLAAILQRSTTMHALVVSAAWEVVHRVRGLAVADDYVVSPFEPDELDARLERLARRAQVAPETIIGRKRLRLSLNERAAYVDGVRLNLPPPNSRCWRCL